VSLSLSLCLSLSVSLSVSPRLQLSVWVCGIVHVSLPLRVGVCSRRTLRQYSVLAAVSGLVLLASGLALLTYSSQLSQSYRDVLLDLPSLGSDAAAINDLDSVSRSVPSAARPRAQCLSARGSWQRGGCWMI